MLLSLRSGQPFLSRRSLAITAVFSAAFSLVMYGQGSPSPDTSSQPDQAPAGNDAQGRDAKGIPARASAADYQAHAQAGTVTIAAEFTGHSIAMPESILSNEDYVMVEVALFGPPQARLRIAHEDFSIRINGKKVPSPADPYGLVFRSLKDPELAPPSNESKSKTSIGGSGNPGDPPPAPVHVPIEVERAMEQHVQKAALPEGDRLLPEAGLLFFEHHGKVQGIKSIELIYNGAAGKATLALQP